MEGILLYFNPEKGVEATVGIQLDAAQAQAWERAEEDYPAIPLHDAHLLYSWHLMVDDESMFFTPKPWPIASFYEMENTLELNGGELPKWLVLLAQSPQSYGHHFLPSKDEARSWLTGTVGEHGGIVADNDAGGLTVTWVSPEDETIVIAYAIPLDAS